MAFTFDDIDSGKSEPPQEQKKFTFADIDAEPSELAQEGPKPVDYNRGFVGDLASAGVRGIYQAAEGLGRGAQMLDFTYEDKGTVADKVGKKIQGWAENRLATSEIARPDKEEAKQGLVKRGVIEGVQSIGPSMSPMLAGLAAGAVNKKLGAVAGFGTLATGFGFGAYHEKRQELDQRTDLPEEEKHRLAMTHATAEFGGELVSDAIAIAAFIGLRGAGKLVGGTAGAGITEIAAKPAGDWAKRTIRQLMAVDGKQAAKALGVTALSEWLSEAGTQYVQQGVNVQAGLEDHKASFMDAMVETAIPTAVMTISFGMLGGALDLKERIKVKDDLNALDPATSEFDQKKRMEAVSKVYSRIPDKEVAEAWKFHALNTVAEGQRFELDDNIVDQATGKLETATRVSDADEKFFTLIKQRNPSDIDLERVKASGRYVKEVDDFIQRRNEDDAWADRVMSDKKLQSDPVKVVRATRIIERRNERVERDSELRSGGALSSAGQTQDQTAQLVDSLLRDLQGNQRELMSDFEEQGRDVAEETGARNRTAKFKGMQENIASLDRNLAPPVRPETSALAQQVELTPAQIEAEKRAQREDDLKSAFSDMTPDELRAPLADMQQQLADAEGTGIRIERADGSYDGVDSTAPEWFKQESRERYDKVHGTKIAKNLSRGSFNRVLDLVRSGKELAPGQQEIWDYLKESASGIGGPNSESARVEKQIEKEGIEWLPPQKVVVGDLSTGDKVIVEKNGAPDIVEVKGRDEDGNILLEDGATFRLDDFDKLEIFGIKRKRQEAQDGVSRNQVSEREGGGRGSETETDARTSGIGSKGQVDQAGIVGARRGAGPEQAPVTGSRNAEAKDQSKAQEGRDAGYSGQVRGTSEARERDNGPDVTQLEQQGLPSPVGSAGRQVPPSPAAPASIDQRKSPGTQTVAGDELRETPSGEIAAGTSPPAVSTEGAGLVEASEPVSKKAESQEPTAQKVDNKTSEVDNQPTVRLTKEQPPTLPEGKRTPETRAGVATGTARQADVPGAQTVTEPSTKEAPAPPADSIPGPTPGEKSPGVSAKKEPMYSKGGTTTGATIPQVEQSLRHLLGRGYDRMKAAGKIEVVRTGQGLPEAVRGNALFMTAWHGSPHRFDKFSTEKIGTGEGAQAFGHGLYFASAKEVAEYYKQGLGGFEYKGEAVSREAIKNVPTDVYAFNKKTGGNVHDFEKWLDSPEGKHDIAKATMYDALTSYSDIPSAKSVLLDKANRIGGKSQYRDAIELLDAAVSSGDLKSTGTLYQVELAPAEDEYLLWDKPLSEQSETVKKAIPNFKKHAKRYGDISKRMDYLSTHGGLDTEEWNNLRDEARSIREELGFAPNDNGEEFYKKISQKVRNEKRIKISEADKAASEYLHSLGIRGIKYLDGSSRAKGEGAYNFVIFNQEDVEIKALYSKNGAIVGAYYQGKIYLVSDRMTPEDVPYVATHEFSHLLLAEDRKFMARKAQILSDFAALRATSKRVQDAYAMVPEDTGLIGKEVYDKLPPDRKAEVDEVRTSEALAYFLQVPKNHRHTIWRRIVAAVKSALFRLGLPTGRLREADFVAIFVSGMKRFANRAGVKESLTTGELAPSFSKQQIQQAAKAIYSKLEQVASSAFQGMKAQSVLNFLNKQGVKKQEIEATGLDAWLKEKNPADKVSRDELLNFVKANAVELEDVVLGAPTETPFLGPAELSRLIELGQKFRAGTVSASERAELNELSARKNKYDSEYEASQKTHFSQYTEPGADEGSYREMFVTAPGYKSGAYVAPYSETEWGVYSKDGRLLGGPYKDKGTADVDAGFANDYDQSWDDGHAAYDSVKNPIVRIRFNTVTTADGKKILRIEEMQGPSKDNQAKMPAYLKENIYQMGVKRILAYAKEQGLNGVGFATKPNLTAGETQADRYSLEKQVSSIDYHKDTVTKDSWWLYINDKQGAEVLNKLVPTSELESIVGKDVAEKIMQGEGAPLPNRNKRLSGLDLKITSTGLVKLYDQDLPRMLEAYGKGKMEEAEVRFAPEVKLVKAEGNKLGRETGPGSAIIPYLPLTDKTPASYPMFTKGETPPLDIADLIPDNEPGKRYIYPQMNEVKDEKAERSIRTGLRGVSRGFDGRIIPLDEGGLFRNITRGFAVKAGVDVRYFRYEGDTQAPSVVTRENGKTTVWINVDSGVAPEAIIAHSIFFNLKGSEQYKTFVTATYQNSPDALKKAYREAIFNSPLYQKFLSDNGITDAWSIPDSVVAPALAKDLFGNILTSGDVWRRAGFDNTQVATISGKATGFENRVLRYHVKNIKNLNDLAERAADLLEVGLNKKPQLSVMSDAVRSAMDEESYAKNRANTKSVKLEMVRGAKSVGRDIISGADKIMGAISTRLGNINPKLKAKIRKLDFDIGMGHEKDVKAVLGLLEKSKKMSREDAADWDYARKNSDVDKINSIVNKYGLEKEYKEYREALDKVREEALSVGMDVDYITEYAPRVLKDSRGFLEAIGKGPDWDVLSRGLKRRADALGIEVSAMTPEMKADIISNILVGGGGYGISGPGNIKERKLKTIPPELNQFYMHSDAALMQYLFNMRRAIEARKFFGKMPETVATAKRNMHAAQAKVRELEVAGEPNVERIEELKENINAYRQIIDRYKIQSDYSENISQYILELLANGEITPADENALKDILQARFHERGARGLVQAYKNLSYIDTMGSPISALTQIGDLAFSVYENGWVRALKGTHRAITKRSRITKADVGVDRIAQEFADNGTLSNAVAKIFKWVGLEKMDAIGKESLLNGSLEKYEDEAKKNPEKLRKEIEYIFGDETGAVISDLQNKEITDNVKLLVYSKLLDYQPVALSEMPEQYLKAGNGRLFYMLKSYTIKQFDVFRREAYNKIKSGDPAHVRQGIQNITYLAMLLVLANAGADELKDFVLNRETDFKDRVIDNVLRLFGISKYATWKARTEGVGMASLKLILPPVKFIDSASRDIITAGDDKGLYSTSSIPLVGKLAYWHIGRGAKSEVELWDHRISKEQKRLEAIENKVDSNSKLRVKYRNELAELRRLDNFRTILLRNRKATNMLKAREKETGTDNSKRIEQFEQRRVEMIKRFINKQ